MSLRDLILSSTAPAPVAVQTPRGTVFVRQMTVLEREQYEEIGRASCRERVSSPV